jgi:hypothetical protein
MRMPCETLSDACCDADLCHKYILYLYLYLYLRRQTERAPGCTQMKQKRRASKNQQDLVRAA